MSMKVATLTQSCVSPKMLFKSIETSFIIFLMDTKSLFTTLYYKFFCLRFHLNLEIYLCFFYRCFIFYFFCHWFFVCFFFFFVFVHFFVFVLFIYLFYLSLFYFLIRIFIFDTFLIKSRKSKVAYSYVFDY